MVFGESKLAYVSHKVKANTALRKKEKGSASFRSFSAAVISAGAKLLEFTWPG